MLLTGVDKLGRYEILAPIGAGGMGEAYKARDTQLGRVVARKVLPAALANDADRRGFLQEAKGSLGAQSSEHRPSAGRPKKDFDSFRSEARFRAGLAQMGLPITKQK